LACIVCVPAPLRPYTGGVDRIELGGASLRDVLTELGEAHKPLYARICEPGGEVRGHVNVYLNEVDIRRLGGLNAPVRDGDEILLVPAIAGG